MCEGDKVGGQGSFLDGLTVSNGDGKIQFLIENTTVTVFIQKFDYGITVIFEKINGNTVMQNLVRPP